MADVSNVPTVNIGSSALIGSWKIIEISAPRTARSSSGETFVRSLPPYVIEPLVIRSGGLACSPRIESAVNDLPQPLSPTIANISF